jgi:polyphenol oxidase
MDTFHMTRPVFFSANWCAHPRVRTLITTRMGGVSAGDFDSWNLGAAVGDDPARVQHNRELLSAAVGHTVSWHRQVHGTDVADLDLPHQPSDADGSVASIEGRPCLAMAADCLPVLFAHESGVAVGASHCGWRGLEAGVLENTLAALRSKTGLQGGWQAWLGPAIGPSAFEVGAEVREAFVAQQAEASSAFASQQCGKYLADIFALARLRLAAAGVQQIEGGGDCTYSQPEKYFSHRLATHKGRSTGRMVAVVWIQ